ncbi:MAG: hypothetical protein QG671_3502 [Actinomycetota bacterium]|nr:hypothetical protein [Actinomycetota bacterium]
MSTVYQYNRRTGKHEVVAHDNPLCAEILQLDGQPVYVAGRSVRSKAFLTRPADTTQYTADDALTDALGIPLEFTGCGRLPGGSGLIVDVIARSSANQLATASPTQELHIFIRKPTATADNSEWAPTDDDMNNWIGCVALNSWKNGNKTAGAGGNSMVRAGQVNLIYVCAPDITSLWGLVVERGTYTPVASERFSYELGLALD